MKDLQIKLINPRAMPTIFQRACSNGSLFIHTVNSRAVESVVEQISKPRLFLVSRLKWASKFVNIQVCSSHVPLKWFELRLYLACPIIKIKKAEKNLDKLNLFRILVSIFAKKTKL